MSAVHCFRPQGSSRIVLCCDHASNAIPTELNDLGLSPSDLTRHIAWDIGAAGVTRALSELLDAPAILCGTSRLVIDCNRHLDAKDLIPQSSDKTTIPGNLRLTPTERTSRITRWFQPYHKAIETIIREREGRGVPTMLVSIHSMTASLGGTPRPWQIALSSYLDRHVVEPVLATLRQPGDICVGDNQPYDLDPKIDYTIPHHALSRGLPHLQVEFRQDEIETATTQSLWAARFAQALP